MILQNVYIQCLLYYYIIVQPLTSERIKFISNNSPFVCACDACADLEWCECMLARVSGVVACARLPPPRACVRACVRACLRVCLCDGRRLSRDNRSGRNSPGPSAITRHAARYRFDRSNISHYVALFLSRNRSRRPMHKAKHSNHRTSVNHARCVNIARLDVFSQKAITFC